MQKIVEANANIIPVGTNVELSDGTTGTIMGYGNGKYRVVTDSDKAVVIFVGLDKIKII